MDPIKFKILSVLSDFSITKSDLVNVLISYGFDCDIAESAISELLESQLIDYYGNSLNITDCGLDSFYDAIKHPDLEEF